MNKNRILASTLWSLLSLANPQDKAPPPQPTLPCHGPRILHRAGSDDDLAQRLQAMLEAHHGRHEFPGVVLALRRPRGTELTLTAGTQRADAAEPGVDADVPWIIGSATKSFVAVTVLQLVQEGRLALDQSVEAWLPTIPWARSITVRHLLQHASGLAEYIDLPEVQREARRAWTADELIDAAVARGCGAGQGKRHAYSNTNYLALGCIVQQVAGRVWYEEVRARVLAPLGMHRTGYAGAGDALAIGPGHGEVGVNSIPGRNLGTAAESLVRR